MDINPIKTDADYRQTLSEIERLMMAERDTPEGDRLDVLVTLVEAYEKRHYPLEAPDPIEAIRFAMDQRGLTVKDMGPIIGRPNRVYEVLSHKRSLTLPMIRRLNRTLHIPAELLIQEARDTA